MRFMHALPVRCFVALDVRQLAAQVAELVDAVQQAIAREGLDREACTARPSGSVRRVRLEIDLDLGARVARAASACVASSTTIGSRPFFSELLRKMSAISVLITARKP